MRYRLHSLCWLSDGVHWLLISATGTILRCSHIGFSTEEEALRDLQNHF